jgi:allantoin racemase
LQVNTAAPVASPATIVEGVTARRGVPYISSRAEGQIAGVALLEMMAEERVRTADAAILACFGDPGLGAARELYDSPIIGISEAGMLTACMLGGNFVIITFAAALGQWFEDCVRWHQLEARCAGVRWLEGGFSAPIQDVQVEKEQALISLANRAIKDLGADVVVLAGAPLAGLARKVSGQIPVPVVDCAEAAIKQAEALVALQARAPTAGHFARPAAKESTKLDGWLSPGLTRQLAGGKL